MTGGTVITHGLLMRRVVLVASNAIGHGVAMLRLRLMAIIAVGFTVFADQLEVRERVVESCFVQYDHVGIPAFMLSVTFIALLGFCFRVLPMKACRSLDIGRDRLMTVHAENSLRAFVEHLVALAALRFDVGMIRNNLTRHDESFDILCIGTGY